LTNIRIKKGQRFEKWVAEFLRKRNHIVDIAHRKVIRIGDKYIFKGGDFFGCFDLISISAEGEITFIQATTHKDWKKDIEKMKEILRRQNSYEIEIWQKVESGKVKVYRYNQYQDIDRDKGFELLFEVGRRK